MRKAIVAITTAALLVGGSLAVLAQTEETEATEERPIGYAIEAVLDDLVADETLTQDQADAVIDALVAKRQEFRTEREQMREQMREFWADDELTQEEIDQLPSWHRWSQASEMLEDGTITRSELGELRRDRDRLTDGTGQGGGPRHGR